MNFKINKFLKIFLINTLILISFGFVLFQVYELSIKNLAANKKAIQLKVDNGEAVLMDRSQLVFLNLLPNTHYNGTISKNNKIIKKLDVNTDSNGFRKTPENYNEKKGAITFFGCSFTFGYGLNDKETLPWRVSELTKRKTYNVSFPGFGTQQMLLNLQSNDFIKKVPKSDLFIYVFMRDHIPRLYGPPFIDPDMYYPKFELLGNKLSYINPSNNYIENRALRKRLNEIDFLKMKHTDLNDKKAIELYVRILEESQKDIKKMYPNARFVVFDIDNCDDIDKLVRKNGIEVIELKDIFPESYYPKYIIKYDCHPNANFWKIISPKLVKKLAL